MEAWQCRTGIGGALRGWQCIALDGGSAMPAAVAVGGLLAQGALAVGEAKENRWIEGIRTVECLGLAVRV